MTSLRPIFITLFLCCAMINQFTTADDIQDLYFILNGYYNNFDQDKVEGGRHVRIEMWWKPVNVSQLQGQQYAILDEETINESVYRLYILTLTKVPNKPTITITYYNFTQPRKYKPGSFNTDYLASLKPKDFHNSDGCYASFKNVAPGIFTGKAMDCKNIVNGQHPWYSVTFTCDALIFDPPKVAKETWSPLSYRLKRKGPRNPWTSLPKDYVSTCKEGK